MAKTAKKREIVAFDPGTAKSYKLADNFLNEITDKEKNSSAYNITYVPGENVMFASIEVPNDSEEDELSIITNKTYELLELDLEKDYKISYSISNASIGVNTVYNVFVIESEKIETDFKRIVNTHQYIDYIDIEPLMYQCYYTSKILDSTGIQVFVYFHKTFTTLSVYKDGELLSYKIIIKLSIDILFSSYIRELGERIPEHMFLNELAKYGFDHPDDAKRVALNKVFAEGSIFLANNLDVILRNFNLSQSVISKVIVGTDKGLSHNFLQKIEILFSRFREHNVDRLIELLLDNKIEISQDSLNVGEFINIHKIKYDISRNIRNFTLGANNSKENGSDDRDNTEININPFVLLSILRANEQLKMPNDVFNVSPFLRPPPFAKRSSGKLILSILGVCILASIYPIYNYSCAYLIEKERKEIEAVLPSKRSEDAEIKRKIQNLNSELGTLNNQINDLRNTLNYRYALLNNIYDKKVNYLSKAKLFVGLANILNDSGIKVTNVLVENNRVNISLKGSTSGVTNFLREIGANDRFKIESKDLLIKSLIQDSSKEYESNIVIRVLR